MSEEIIIFTSQFPYGKAENFFENELPVLSGKFKRVQLVPLTSQVPGKRLVPVNVVLSEALNERKHLRSSVLFSSNFFLVCRILATEFSHCPNKRFFLKKIRHFNSLLIRGIYDAKKIRQLVEKETASPVLYSLWMNDWALALAVLKAQGKIRNFVFRCGGFDIYDERHEGNYLPFRYFIYQQASGIFPNSVMGENYLKNKKIFSEKIKVKYLGTGDHGINELKAGSDNFTLVSCSNLIPLKRVHLIIEILKRVNFKLTWVHFGDGACLPEIEALIKTVPSNITAELKGSVPNPDIIAFYKTVPVNLFITTSETEGLPVSIQEAISFGIPVIATNVGGIPEIVNEQTGFLIEKDFNVDKVADLIRSFKTSPKNEQLFREGVRRFWKNHFNANDVYTRFAEELKKTNST